MQLVGHGLRPGHAVGSVWVVPPRPGIPAPFEPPARRAIAAAPAEEDVPHRPDGWAGVILGRPRRSSEGARPAEPPVVGNLEGDLFRTGDRATVDGTAGTVDLPDVEAVPVVTSFLERPDGRVLLLRRSQKVGTFRGRWAGVSGYLEASSPEAQARQEIREEVGFADPDLVRAATAPPVYARDEHRMFVVHPFRFRVRRTDVRLDWEHTESEWVEPGEIVRRPTVPKLDRVWAAVAAPAPEEKRV